MHNFELINPTKLIFGRGVVDQVGTETLRYGKRVLLVMGRNSAHHSGAYDTVCRSLRDCGLEVFELSGVLPNPRLSTCLEGVQVCKDNAVEVVIGLGGGSVLDSAKAIAAGACYAGNLWDFFEKKAEISTALPVVGIMTLAATGSEYNRITVIKNEEQHKKIGLWNEHLFPRVSLVDPELTFSVPPLYTAYSGVDIISHVLERYVTAGEQSLIQQRFKEALMRSVKENVETAQADPTDYEARSTLMWASSLACSSLFDAGIAGSDIPAHIIDTEAASFSDHAHGAGLAVLLPAVMTFYLQRHLPALIRFTRQVMGLERTGDVSDEAYAALGIEAFRLWLDRIGCPITVKALGIDRSHFSQIARQVDENAEGPDEKDTLGILETYAD